MRRGSVRVGSNVIHLRFSVDIVMLIACLFIPSFVALSRTWRHKTPQSEKQGVHTLPKMLRLNYNWRHVGQKVVATSPRRTHSDRESKLLLQVLDSAAELQSAKILHDS